MIAVPSSSAAFVATSGNGPNSFASGSLAPPTTLQASGGGEVGLKWEPTVDVAASGHRVYRSIVSGGPYTLVAEVTPRTVSTYTYSPPAGTGPDRILIVDASNEQQTLPSPSLSAPTYGRRPLTLVMPNSVNSSNKDVRLEVWIC